MHSATNPMNGLKVLSDPQLLSGFVSVAAVKVRCHSLSSSQTPSLATMDAGCGSGAIPSLAANSP